MRLMFTTAVMADESIVTQNREEAEGQLLSAPLLFVRHPLNTGEQQLGLILVFNPDPGYRHLNSRTLAQKK